MNLNENTLNLVLGHGRRVEIPAGGIPRVDPSERLVMIARNPFGWVTQLVTPEAVPAHLEDHRRKLFTEMTFYTVPDHVLPIPGTLLPDAEQVGNIVTQARHALSAAADRRKPGGFRLASRAAVGIDTSGLDLVPGGVKTMWADDVRETQRLEAENRTAYPSNGGPTF